MSDILVKDGTMRPVAPMNGEYYTEPEFYHHLGTRTPRIDETGIKLLCYDGDGCGKGKLPNRIASGWRRQDGFSDVVFGVAMLISKEHLKQHTI